MKILWRSKLQKMVVAGVMAALLAVLTQISIPLPTGIPVTLQTFVVALCGYLLGPGLGTLSVGVYLALGAMGLPVFAGFAGGLASFAGMTGGYLWSFLPMACLCGLGARRGGKAWALVLGALGLVVCHLCGAFQFAAVMSLSPWQAFLTASAPYLIKDALSLVLAYGAAEALLYTLKRARLVSLG